MLCFALSILCFILGGTLATSRSDVPEITIITGQVIFLAWPPLTIATAYLRYKGRGARDGLLWTSLTVLLIPAAAILFLVWQLLRVF